MKQQAFNPYLFDGRVYVIKALQQKPGRGAKAGWGKNSTPSRLPCPA